jgi:hypothetical protein
MTDTGIVSSLPEAPMSRATLQKIDAADAIQRPQ